MAAPTVVVVVGLEVGFEGLLVVDWPMPRRTKGWDWDMRLCWATPRSEGCCWPEDWPKRLLLLAEVEVLFVVVVLGRENMLVAELVVEPPSPPPLPPKRLFPVVLLFVVVEPSPPPPPPNRLFPVVLLFVVVEPSPPPLPPNKLLPVVLLLLVAPPPNRLLPPVVLLLLFALLPKSGAGGCVEFMLFVVDELFVLFCCDALEADFWSAFGDSCSTVGKLHGQETHKAEFAAPVFSDRELDLPNTMFKQ